MNADSLIEKEHHQQQELCKTRPAYRQGRKLTAVKVYTINNESQHLFIYEVPKINLRSELKALCLKYGELFALHVVVDHKSEIFTECYHVHYRRIQSARIAKRLLDNKSFYGGVLHVCYAPEYESVEETRAKLLQRNKDILSRLNISTESNQVPARSYVEVNRRRKRPAVELSEQRMACLNADVVWKNVPQELDPRRPNVKYLKADEPVKHYQIPGVEYGPSLSDFKDSGELCMPAFSEQGSTGKQEDTGQTVTQVIPAKTPVICSKTNILKRIVFKNKS